MAIIPFSRFIAASEKKHHGLSKRRQAWCWRYSHAVRGTLPGTAKDNTSLDGQNLVHVVGLVAVCGDFVSLLSTAFFTLVNQLNSLSRGEIGANRLHEPMTGGAAVSGLVIDME